MTDEAATGQIFRGVGRLRVAYVVTRMDVGGVPDHIMTLVRGLQSSMEILIVCGSIDERHERELAELGVEVRIVRLKRLLAPWADLGALFDLVALFRSRPIDIVHTHMSKAALLGGVAAAMARVPVAINTAHNLGFLALSNPLLRAFFWGYDRLLFGLTVDAVITVSDRVRTRVVDSRIANEKKVVAIRNGIDTSMFADGPKARRGEFGAGEDDVLVVTVARLVWFKGLSVLVDAAAEVLERCPKAFFLVVGEGPQRDELEQRARDLKINGRIVFAGERRDVPAILAAADIFALSSVSEGLPISILEAMAAGKAVVATDVGGIPELVQHGATGLLAPARDPKAFADRLATLAADSDLRRSMGIKGQALVRQQFSPQRTTALTASLYERLFRFKSRGRQGVSAVADNA